MKSCKTIILSGILTLFSAAVGTGCYYDSKENLYASTGCDTTAVTYTSTIAPLLNGNCMGCHGNSSPSAGVSLTSYTLVKQYASTGQLSGTVNQSAGYEAKLMPPGGKMDNCKLKQIDKWIRLGMPQ